MPKRKCAPCDSLPQPTLQLGSLDAALDLLACDTFTRLDGLTAKFESCAKVKLEEGVVKARWEEAVKRYWVMKSMDELCCTAKKAAAKELDGENMDEDYGEKQDGTGRPLPNRHHPGAIATHDLKPEEEREWRRWTPRIGDIVLVETAEDGFWPGKIIDKKTFFQGRTVPRGNHFFPVRIYSEDMSPIITVKARLIPLNIRPNPPLLASPALLSAYHHAASPTTFDMLAAARESLAAHNRTHPGVGDESDKAQLKADKDAWNKTVNWVMNERRVEKLRSVSEEREKQLKLVIKSEVLEGKGEGRERPCNGEAAQEMANIFGPKKRKTYVAEPEDTSNSSVTEHSIFGPVNTRYTGPSTPQRISSPSLASYIRPNLSTPQRPNSPRRSSRDKRRNGIFTGMGESSPRGRGGTYTPPRILPSGDETAVRDSGSPVPTLQKFDFVSPLGPVRRGKLANGDGHAHISGGTDSSPTMLGNVGRSGSLEVVKEEDEEDGWTVVQKKGRRRAGSEPAAEKKEMKTSETTKEDEAMDL
uniref:PWWP domain-containing protein n=1 Tax=Kwoniella dejecticola CBS 10117 TaxID=1296121 RepID=A0A1A6A4K1_9TREE|nr:uncharacterized protein I303_04318 [Kwoniella dejecticola CBS 10117]OBR84991.1 hypothetical protein I303_04318 [Kwoniella dejecticola CBS 10117]